MSKRDQFRKVLEKCVSNFLFRDGVDVQKAVEDSHYCMVHYFAKTDEEKATVEVMFSIISEIAKQYNSSVRRYSKEQLRGIVKDSNVLYKLNLRQYSDQQLMSVVDLFNKESSNGAYTSDLGVVWYGAWQLDELKQLYGELKRSSMTPTERLIDSVLNGDILKQLDTDFPDIELQDKQAYLSYINGYWRRYACNTFAVYKNYKLEIVCTGVLDASSIYNAMNSNLTLNNYLGFRLVNTKTAHIMKVTSYSDIKRILRSSK